MRVSVLALFVLVAACSASPPEGRDHDPVATVPDPVPVLQATPAALVPVEPQPVLEAQPSATAPGLKDTLASLPGFDGWDEPTACASGTLLQLATIPASVRRIDPRVSPIPLGVLARQWWGPGIGLVST